MVRLEINGHLTEVEPGTTLLQAARQENIEIPTMCYLEGVNEVGACRMCAVEVEGRPRLMTACETEAAEGMVVRTNSPRARHAREVLFELLMSDHPADCLHCARDGACELQDLGRTLGASTSRASRRATCAATPRARSSSCCRSPSNRPRRPRPGLSP